MFRMKKKNVKKMTTIAYRKNFCQCYNIIDRFARYSHILMNIVSAVLIKVV